MDEKVNNLVRKMIVAARAGRHFPTAQALNHKADEFTRRGAIGHGRYPLEMDLVAAAELETRATEYLAIATRIFADTETAWTPDSADAVLFIVRQEILADHQLLLDRLRSTLGPDWQVRIDGLDGAKDRAGNRLENEFALLVLNQDRSRIPLSDLLSAPRYECVFSSWLKADAFFRASPPDYLNGAKESVGSVEALARIMIGEPNKTLGAAIKELANSGRMPSVSLKGLEELWGLTSSTPGVRHGGSASDLDPRIARYILELSGASLRLLLSFDSAL